MPSDSGVRIRGAIIKRKRLRPNLRPFVHRSRHRKFTDIVIIFVLTVGAVAVFSYLFLFNELTLKNRNVVEASRLQLKAQK